MSKLYHVVRKPVRIRTYVVDGKYLYMFALTDVVHRLCAAFGNGLATN